MARRNRKGESVMGYFRQVLAQHPEWISAKSNVEVLDQYRKDHGLASDAPLGNKIKAGMANTKSLMKRDKGAKGRARAAVAAAPAGKKLDRLECMIDDCLLFARNLDPSDLEHVIELLRRARNIVVWKGGKP